MIDFNTIPTNEDWDNLIPGKYYPDNEYEDFYGKTYSEIVSDINNKSGIDIISSIGHVSSEIPFSINSIFPAIYFTISRLRIPKFLASQHSLKYTLIARFQLCELTLARIAPPYCAVFGLPVSSLFTFDGGIVCIACISIYNFFPIFTLLFLQYYLHLVSNSNFAPNACALFRLALFEAKAGLATNWHN